MKKFFIFAIVLAVILPGVASAKDPSLFSVYLKDRSTENFLKAWEHYEGLRADTANYSAAVVLGYLSLIELEKNLGILEENKGELKNKTMFSYGNILLEMGEYDESIAIYEILKQGGKIQGSEGFNSRARISWAIWCSRSSTRESFFPNTSNRMNPRRWQSL